MLSLLKRRGVLIAIGFLLLAVFIWWAWEFFRISIAGYPPDSVAVRLLVIGVVIGLWAAVLLGQQLRSRKAGEKLMAAVIRQREPKGQPSAEAQQLRERFEEAVAALRGSRGPRASLYDLPWYIIVGAPGSGKTTVLANAGLHLPSNQRSGRGALRGVGGTRNCDWWFTDEAVFLDTAGRYTTQDSDPGSDSAAWNEFLGLLRQYRQRRPVNGVLVAMSARDLMTQGQAAREEHVAAVRRRLEELNARFGIQLPVYVLITKCDLVAGFSEYFADLTPEARAQVWGVTFPYERTRNSEAAAAFPEELDALVQRLNERVFGRVQAETDPRRRARAFAFPQEFAALRAPLSEFVAEVFGSTRFDRTILLRGVYFTSGTQEGTPIDRLLGALGRQFAAAPEAVAPAGRGKAYFIERFLKEVMIPESGLAGVNRRLEVRKAAAQLAGYAAMLAVGVLGVIALSVSYVGNRAFVRDVERAALAIRQTPAVPETASVELMLPRLNAVEQVFAVASRHQQDTPWSMRWGLYQGGALADDARAAYVDVLNGPLLANVATRFRERINGYAAEPIALYEYLKGYLILVQPPTHARIDQSDRDHLAALAKGEWQAPSAAESEIGPLMLRHFGNLLAQSSALRPIPRDADTEALIQRAQTTVRQASIAQLAYLRLRRASEQDVNAALRLDRAAGLRVEEVLRRKDGVSLTTPMLSLYTKKAFEELSAPGAINALIEPLAKEQWVWGEDMPVRRAADLETELFDLYEKDYIARWDTVLRAIEVRQPGSSTQAADSLALLSGPTSPLRNLLRTIDEQTFLVKPAAPKPEGGLISSAKDGVGKLVAPLLGGPAGAVSRPDMARERITAHFAELHRQLSGDAGAAPIDRVLGQLGQLQEKVKQVGPMVGNKSALDPGSQAAINDLTRELRSTAAGLPAPLDALVGNVAGGVETVVLQGVRGDLVNQYAQAVGVECRELVDGRYPLSASARDEVTPADFGRVFGYGGVFDRFFATTLEPLVDVSRRPWTWRPTIANAAVGPTSMLRQFETARHIRDNFFRPGSQTLELSFRVSPVELDARVSKFSLLIDGQPITYQHGPEQVVRITWPGAVGQAVATFVDRSPVPPSIEIGGNWALFRLIDMAQVQSESETRHVLSFSKNGYTARIRLEADSNRNPFHRRDLVRSFRCGA